MKKLILVLSVILFLLSFESINAKRYVKIATIGAVSPQFEKGASPQKMVDGMIEFWERELQQVLSDKPDLIVLPEECDRPRGLNTEEQFIYFQVRVDQVQDYFRLVAKANHCYIAFGTKRQIKDGSWRNSCTLLDRKGNTVGIYNKNFPTLGEMEAGIKAGKEAPVFQCDFGRVAIAICFDLNFDELRQRFAKQKPDIILFPSMYHGGLVQSYWAYSCRAFFVGSMGVSKIPSEIRNPMGEVVATSTNYFHFTTGTINLDYRMTGLGLNWEKLRALKEKYGEKVNIYEPGKVGSVIIYSEHDDISADEMIREFEIESLDDYFNRVRVICKQSENHE